VDFSAEMKLDEETRREDAREMCGREAGKKAKKQGIDPQN
jgi:hypothetical protein